MLFEPCVAQPTIALTPAQGFVGRSMCSDWRPAVFPHAALGPPLHTAQVVPRMAYVMVVVSVRAQTLRAQRLARIAVAPGIADIAVFTVAAVTVAP